MAVDLVDNIPQFFDSRFLLLCIAVKFCFGTFSPSFFLCQNPKGCISITIFQLFFGHIFIQHIQTICDVLFCQRMIV